MKPTKLQNSRVERLIRNSGAFRVSAGAVTALNELLVQEALRISKFAVEIASHSGRKTVKDSDIILAAQK